MIGLINSFLGFLEKEKEDIRKREYKMFYENKKFKCLKKGCKGSYLPTTEMDRKGFLLLECNKCGDIAI